VDFFLSIQYPHPGAQISREDKPNDVRDLQKSGKRVYLIEYAGHPNHQCQQHKQPKERKTERLQIKEYQAPEEVDYQLRHEQIDPYIPFLRTCG
jgi:endo-alpha-1,4-polygalactosaminidase (GH114 family)